MKKLDIVYEDKNIIVVNKESNLLTISTVKDKYNNLYRKVSDYVKKQNKNNKIFIVHRLDKETSGLVVFAKNRDSKIKLQNVWKDSKREYLALLEGNLKENSNTLKLYLEEDANHYVYVSKDKTKDLSITNYQVLNRYDNKTLVSINILTGKKNQIRVSMRYIHHPIVGDKKYGAKTNPYRRLMLHAASLEFINPSNNKKIKLEADIPKVFLKGLENES